MNGRQVPGALWLALISVVAVAAAGQDQTTQLHCGALIDGTSDEVRTDVAIVVEGDRIVAVRDGSAVDQGADTVVDLRDATCLPGLIDAHVHLLIETDDYQVDHLRRSSAYKALRGLRVAQEMLRAGWTTVRVVGDADVRSIEHGTFLDRDGIELMAERGTFLIPTLTIGEPDPVTRDSTAKERALHEQLTAFRPERYRRLGAALDAGVRIGVGTDYVGTFTPAEGTRELAYLVEAGMTPMAAIQAATRVNAELLGRSDRIGTIEPGKWADIIAVPGDPLEDLSLLQRVSFVMLGGERVGSGGS